jgi:hypothetical protein
MNKTKEKIRIFLTFFIIYSLFIHWVGWNEQSRLLTAISIVDQKSLDINMYHNFTGDKISIKNSYYSDKPPGISFFLSSIYFFIENLSNERFYDNSKDYILVPKPQFNSTTYIIDKGIEKSVLLTMSIGVIIFSSIIGALSVLLFKEISACFFSEKTSLWLSIIFGLSTLVFPYSTVLMGNIFSLFLILLAFYFFKKNHKKKSLLSGFFISFSILFDYTALLVAIPLSLYILKKETKKEKAIFLLSSMIGILPLVLYQSVITHSIIFVLEYYLHPKTSIPQTYVDKIFEVILNIFRHLLSPYRGIIIYSPILVFFFFSIYKYYKKNKELFNFSILTFFFYLISISFHSYWFGGSSFGSRYLLNLTPFIILPIGYFIDDKKNPLILRYLFLTLTIISSFHMFLSTSVYWEGRTFNSSEIPLYQHYLPAFLRNGPRSRMLEYFLIGEAPDIRDFKQIPSEEIKLLTLPIGFLVLKIPYLAFSIILIILIVIWRSYLVYYKIGRISIWKLLLILAIIFLLTRITIKNVFFGKEWLPLSPEEGIRWMSNSSKIYIFSPTEDYFLLSLSMVSYREKNLEIHLNDKLLYSYISPGNIVEIIKLKKGENVLTFYSKNGCEVPMFTENKLLCFSILECKKLNISIYEMNFDSRCLSIGIKNISIVPLASYLKNNDTIMIYGSGFYSQEREGKWVSQEAIIYLYSPSEKNVFINLSIDLYPTLNLSLFLNREYLGTYNAQTILERVKLKKGINELKLNSSKCFIPAHFYNSSKDYRCLSVFVRNASVIDESNLRNGIYFGSNWYDLEKADGINFRWFPNLSKIYIKNDKPGIFLIKFYTWTTVNQSRVLKIYLDNRLIGEIEVNDTPRRIALPLLLNNTINKLIFISKECTRLPSDSRCLSVAVSEINIEKLSIENLNEAFNGFYEKEFAYNKIFRWMSNISSVKIFSPTDKRVEMKIETGWTYLTNRVLGITINSQKIMEKIFRTPENITIPIWFKTGWNEITLWSTCDIPAKVENSKDERCLSIMIFSIEFLTS